MLKIFIGFLLGCFITYNYIIPNEDYKIMLDHANKVALDLIDNIQESLKNNVEN